MKPLRFASAVLESARRLRWLPTGNVRTISAANFLTGLYQNVLNVVLQRFVLSFGGGLTLLGFLQAVGGRFGLVASLAQPIGGDLGEPPGGGAPPLPRGPPPAAGGAPPRPGPPVPGARRGRP